MLEIFMGADRIGYELKRELVPALRLLTCDVEDLGPFDAISVHYPVVAEAVARRVVQHPGSFGVLVCSTGLGMTMAANKTKGIRAANCTSAYLARMARAHNDANVLCLGASLMGSAAAMEIVEAFIGTAFEGGKNIARVQMLDEKAPKD
jgi:ribose 5-phosphate isomerase B